MTRAGSSPIITHFFDLLAYKEKPDDHHQQQQGNCREPTGQTLRTVYTTEKRTWRGYLLWPFEMSIWNFILNWSKQDRVHSVFEHYLIMIIPVRLNYKLELQQRTFQIFRVCERIEGEEEYSVLFSWWKTCCINKKRIIKKYYFFFLFIWHPLHKKGPTKTAAERMALCVDRGNLLTQESQINDLEAVDESTSSKAEPISIRPSSCTMWYDCDGCSQAGLLDKS